MSEWIKLSDRLPEINEHVLFFEPGPNEPCRVGCLIKQKDHMADGSSEWHIYLRDLHTGSTMTLGWFTHWMPLPEPPKGE